MKRDVEGNYLKVLRDFRAVGERLDAATREERLVGSADIPNLMRTAAGPGWALVGDAAFHKDPTPADGITDAFR
ncbi:MAG: NAD(P)/FAD-dependent oxidoreductase, partial [Actinomycetota bacterium]|nr:NAD(P)/FAD-dependent oxidoreductase [Actinomycetota bacterium]